MTITVQTLRQARKYTYTYLCARPINLNGQYPLQKFLNTDRCEKKVQVDFSFILAYNYFLVIR